MYHFFSVCGGHQSMSCDNARALMKRVAPEWRSHKTPLGILYTEVHPWAISIDDFGNTKEHPPHLRDGGRLHWNTYASGFFDMDIYGDCVLQASGEMCAEVTPAVCRYDRDGKSLAQQGKPKANAETA